MPIHHVSACNANTHCISDYRHMYKARVTSALISSKRKENPVFFHCMTQLQIFGLYKNKKEQ